MSDRYYDVVVLGADLGASLAAALLAKRDFRVLLLGQGTLAPSYEIAGRSWPRRPYTFVSSESEPAQEVLSELAMGQLFRRHATQFDPAFQFVSPDWRFDASIDSALLDQEFSREMPEAKRQAIELHKLVRRAAGELGQVLGRDLSWPPTGFFAKREFARAISHRVFDRRGAGFAPLAGLSPSHPLSQLISVPASFAAHMDVSELSPLGLLRLYHGWWRGSAKLEGGLTWLLETLHERVRAHSGDIRLRDKASSIQIKRGTATGVTIDGTSETIGAGAVVTSLGVSELAGLLPNRALLREVFEKLGQPRTRFFRYTLNVLADAAGFPEGLGRDSFAVFDKTAPLHGENMLRLELAPKGQGDERLVTVEALLPRRGVEEAPRYLDTIRERILGALVEVAPFFGDHIRMVDSPHDGRDLLDYRTGTFVSSTSPWNRGASTMEPVHAFPVMGELGVCALPIRMPVKRLFLCGSQVAPGLGEEGVFLSARSVAKVLSREDSGRYRVRRGMV